MGSSKRLLGRFFFALAAILMLAPGATTAKQAVPFSALIAIAEQLGGPAAGCTFVATLAGTGSASHMGKVSSTSQDCVNPIGPGKFSFSSDNIVLTAANGDQLFGTYNGEVDATSGIGVISGVFTITGGTGRFSKATGGGVIQGLEALDLATGAGQGQIQLKGTVSY